MKLQILLSVMKFSKEKLDKMNIKSKCIVIDQCEHNGYEKYKNFEIFYYDEKGLSKSRNRGLEKATEDIILLCDDDVIYNDEYEQKILKAFKDNPKADMILFNLYSPNRICKYNKTNKRVHFYNSFRYASTSIAFKRKILEEKDIKFNEKFGSGAKFRTGEDTIFIVNCLKKKMKVYGSKEYIGTVYHEKSNWFNGYTDEFFQNKGSVFYEIDKRIYYLLCLQYYIRHKKEFKEVKFLNAWRNMMNGVKLVKEDVKSEFNKNSS